MLSFRDFFTACAGTWTTERTYHYMPGGEVERSFTKYEVAPLTWPDKAPILEKAQQAESALAKIRVDETKAEAGGQEWPGFSIAFDTVSETGDRVSMKLKALFVPDGDVIEAPNPADLPPLPVAAQVTESADAAAGIIRGYYLRDEGYSESGAIAGRFTYQPVRQVLEMTTYYRRSVAVDQMRLVAPNLRLRTIVTYQRPEDPAQPPTVVTLIGFGAENRQTTAPQE